jgi:uncharacterized membrane protein
MTGSLADLALAVGLFVVSHLVLPITALRNGIIGIIGRSAYLLLYSAISIALLLWIVEAYGAAPIVDLFAPNTAMRHATLTLMLIAVFLAISGVATPNPSAVPAQDLGWKPEVKGVFKITRHPLMWGIAIWGGCHFLANGHAAALILFGGMTVLALGGAMHIDRRKRESLGEEWRRFEEQTSFVPLAAIAMGKVRMERREIPWWQTLIAVAAYIGLLAGHAALGRDVFPLGFF